MNHRFLSLFLMLGLLACDDNNAPKTVGDLVNPTVDAFIPTNTIPPDMMMNTVQPDMMVIPVKGAKELQIQGAVQRGVLYGEQLELSVKYIEQQPGAMAVALPNQVLTMKMLNAMNQDMTAQGINGSRIQSVRANTNAQGIGNFLLFAGNQDATFKLEVSAADAQPVSFNITVQRPSSGDIKVKVTYNTRTNRYRYTDFSQLNVYLFEGRVVCDTLLPNINSVRGAYSSFPPVIPFNDLNNTVTDSDYDHGAIFTVLAVLPNVAGSKALAYGCVENQVIQGGQVLSVEIAAKDLPQEYKGRYTSTNKFDLSDLLTTSGDPTLARVAEVMNILRLIGSGEGDSGGQLVRLLCDIANIDQAACNIASTIGGPLLTSFISNLDPNVLRILQVVSDVLTVVAEMTIVGEIEISNRYPDDMNMLLTNANRWLIFRFLWRNGCAMGMDCYREFTIGNLNSLRDPIEGVFDAQVNGNRLTINAHGLSFKYGLIALGLAETWIFPQFLNQPGPIALNDALNQALAGVCMQIDATLNNPNFCRNVLITALSAIITDQLSRLDFAPEQFTISGTVDSKDENNDLLIDQLINGIWDIAIEINDTTTIHSKGCFSACRDTECPAPLNDCVIPAP
jgi:hypothetical protein